MDEIGRDNMTFTERLEKLILVQGRAKDSDMKRIWYNKQVQLIEERKKRAYERLEESARSVH